MWGRGEAYTGYWWGNLNEGDHLGDPDVDGRIILIWMFRKCFSGDEIEKTEMGGACSACGGEERRIQGIGGET